MDTSSSSIVPTAHWNTFNEQYSKKNIEEAVAKTEDFIITVQRAREGSIQTIADDALKFLMDTKNSNKLASRMAQGIVNKNSNSISMLQAFESLESAFSQFNNEAAQKVSNQIHQVLDQVEQILNPSFEKLGDDNLKNILKKVPTLKEFNKMSSISKKFHSLSRELRIQKINEEGLPLCNSYTWSINRISQYFGNALAHLLYFNPIGLKGSDDDLIKLIKLLKNVHTIDTSRSSLVNSNMNQDKSYCRITDKIFAHFTDLPYIQKLSIVLSRITDKEFTKISKLKHLEVLNLSLTDITDEAVISIAQLPNLKTLDLSFCRMITDVALPQLVKLKKLEKLNLADCPVTDKGLIEIAKLENLNELNLHDCPITGPGLAHLANMKQLRILKMHFPKSDEDKSSIKNLQEKAPHLEIQFYIY